MRLTRLDLCLAGFFALLAVAQVSVFQYHAPYFDHWDLARYLEAADRGELTLKILFEPHGGHWHAGGYILLVPLAFATGWSHLAEALVSLALIGVSCALALVLAKRFARAATPEARFTPYVVTTAFLLFSLDQSSNMLWGFQLSVFTSQLGALIGIVALTGARLDIGHLLVAALGLGWATSSYATGFALIPIGLGLIAVHAGASTARRCGYALVWVIASGLLCAAYVQALKQSPEATVGASEALTQAQFLATFVLFELNFLGAGVSRFATDLIIPCAFIGLIGAACAMWLLKRRGVSLAAVSIPAALCAFGIGSGLLIGLGRAEWGAGQAENARYITFSSMFWLGFAFLALATLNQLQRGTLRRATMTVLAVLILLKVGNSIQSAAKHARLSAEIAQVADAMQSNPNAAFEIAAPAQNIGPHIVFIREKRWSAFRRTEPRD